MKFVEMFIPNEQSSFDKLKKQKLNSGILKNKIVKNY